MSDNQWWLSLTRQATALVLSTTIRLNTDMGNTDTNGQTTVYMTDDFTSSNKLLMTYDNLYINKRSCFTWKKTTTIYDFIVSTTLCVFTSGVYKQLDRFQSTQDMISVTGNKILLHFVSMIVQLFSNDKLPWERSSQYWLPVHQKTHCADHGTTEAGHIYNIVQETTSSKFHH